MADDIKTIFEKLEKTLPGEGRKALQKRFLKTLEMCHQGEGWEQCKKIGLEKIVASVKFCHTDEVKKMGFENEPYKVYHLACKPIEPFLIKICEHIQLQSRNNSNVSCISKDIFEIVIGRKYPGDKTYNNEIAFWEACKHGHVNYLNMFLKLKLDPLSYDESTGKNAFDYAKEQKDKIVQSELREVLKEMVWQKVVHILDADVNPDENETLLFYYNTAALSMYRNPKLHKLGHFITAMAMDALHYRQLDVWDKLIKHKKVSKSRRQELLQEGLFFASQKSDPVSIPYILRHQEVNVFKKDKCGYRAYEYVGDPRLLELFEKKIGELYEQTSIPSTDEKNQNVKDVVQTNIKRAVADFVLSHFFIKKKVCNFVKKSDLKDLLMHSNEFWFKKSLLFGLSRNPEENKASESELKATGCKEFANWLAECANQSINDFRNASLIHKVFKQRALEIDEVLQKNTNVSSELQSPEIDEVLQKNTNVSSELQSPCAESGDRQRKFPCIFL